MDFRFPVIASLARRGAAIQGWLARGLDCFATLAMTSEEAVV